MADRRLNREHGPRGNRRPAGSRNVRPRAASGGGRPEQPRPQSRPTQPRRTKPRPKLTGRAAVLLVVLVVLAVSYASSMRTWMQQRDHIDDLQAQINKTEAEIARLEREKRRLSDDAYVMQQARERFNYVLPGEKTYRVLDENGEPLDLADQLDDPVTAEPEIPEAWWSTAWNSVLIAGQDPTDEDQLGPADKLEAPKQ